MFIHYRTEGVILKKEERGEADFLFTAYTKNFGKLKILGRAVRKISSKLKPATGIFYLSEIEFIQGKKQKTLTDAILIGKPLSLAEDLKKIRIAYKIAEVLDQSARGQEPDEKIWQLLTGTFRKLDDWNIKNSKPEIIYYYFFWNLAAISGYQPELHYCVLCHKKIIQEKNYFSPKEGGIVCQNCFPKKPAFAKASAGEEISPETIKILRIILKKDWATLLKLKFEAQYLKELSLISRNYL